MVLNLYSSNINFGLKIYILKSVLKETSKSPKMFCSSKQKDGNICNRPAKIGKCCGYHQVQKNPKKLNEEFWKYKKNRKWIEKIDLDIDSIKTMEKNNIAIIVPYRDNPEQNRAKQLQEFIEYYHNYLPNLDIYIVEQSEGKKFNRGILLNIGFYIAKTSKDYKQYIFHDVDLLSPKELRKVYAHSEMDPIHIASLWTEKYTFSTFLGGIISFSKEAFEAINGFPNCFFGWGGEDDAMYNRLAELDIPVWKLTSKKDIQIKGMEHPQSKEDNSEKKENVLRDLKVWKKEGLNSIDKCFVVSDEVNLKYSNVHKITVDI